MNDFQQWRENNKEKLNLLNRNELIDFSYYAGIESIKPKQKLKFGNREIIEYELKTELTLENQKGFEINYNHQETWITQEELQIKLNENNGLNIIDWLQASQEDICIIEFSKDDIIDYSDLVDEEGASCKCGRSFLAFIKQSLKFIEIIEVIETCD